MNVLSEAFIASCPDAGIPLTDDYNGPVQEGVGPTQVCACTCDSGRAQVVDGAPLVSFTVFQPRWKPLLYVPCVPAGAVQSETRGNAAPELDRRYAGARSESCHCRKPSHWCHVRRLVLL